MAQGERKPYLAIPAIRRGFWLGYLAVDAPPIIWPAYLPEHPPASGGGAASLQAGDQLVGLSCVEVAGLIGLCPVGGGGRLSLFYCCLAYPRSLTALGAARASGCDRLRQVFFQSRRLSPGCATGTAETPVEGSDLVTRGRSRGALSWQIVFGALGTCGHHTHEFGIIQQTKDGQQTCEA